MTTDLKELALAAKAATAAYIADPTDRETGRQWDRACAEFSLACTEDAILALIRERDEALLWQGRVDNELSAVATAIGTVEFMDPPDGGDVSLSEQVSRMRAALSAAREEVKRWTALALHLHRCLAEDGNSVWHQANLSVSPEEALADLKEALKETPHAER